MAERPHLALVTGASKRIGRAIALRLARDGCDIALHFSTSGVEAEAVAREIAALGRRAELCSFDQRDDSGMDNALASLNARFGYSPDILVNSASIAEIDFVATVDRASLVRHYDINVAGPVMLAQKFAAALGGDRDGVVINITDHKLFNLNADHFAYTLSKAALQAATGLLARELAPRIRVCAVAPGHVLPGPGESREHFDAMHPDTLLRRGATPEDVAAAVAIIVASPWMTGQTLIADAGAHLVPRENDQTLMSTRPES